MASVLDPKPTSPFVNVILDSLVKPVRSESVLTVALEMEDALKANAIVDQALKEQIVAPRPA
jgi:hypothetical protein